MLRQWLRRFGVVRVSAAMTIISVVISVLLTTLLTTLMGGGGPGRLGLFIAIVVPLVIAPIMSLRLLGLLSRLDETEGRLRALSITDELTQAYNRRYFISLAEAELARSRRYGGTCSLAILDLDRFKEVNDTNGHLAGDEALREFSRLCRESLRAADTFARYGGDEFIILLPGTTPATAVSVVDRIRASLAGHPDGHLSLSGGVAGLDPAVPDLDQLVKRADDALYVAKRSGGNRVVEA
jgi:diguanylate cyclase (GGDEF)-like protein